MAIQTVQLSGMGTVPSPQIDGISPTSGSPRQQVMITGTNFGATQGSGRRDRWWRYVPCPSWSNTSIAIQVPSRATTGNIVVTAGGTPSNGLPSPSMATPPSPAFRPIAAGSAFP